MTFVVVVIVISMYQEHKAETALAALRDLSAPRALVVRDGQRVRIAGREAVRGDVAALYGAPPVGARVDVPFGMRVDRDGLLVERGLRLKVRRPPHDASGGWWACVHGAERPGTGGGVSA